MHRAVHHVEKAEYKKGLEDDVVFWTKLIRKTQEMSLPPDPIATPTNPPVSVGTDPPVGSVTSPPVGTPPPVVVDPTDPPVGTPPPVAVDPTDPPVAGPGGDFPTYPPTTAPPAGTSPPVVVDPTDPPVGTPPPVVVDPTDPPVAGPVDPTDPPVAGPATTPPVAVDPTDPPVSAFKCPDVSKIECSVKRTAITLFHRYISELISNSSHPNCSCEKQASFVMCTAPDPTDFQDECPVVGEPCPDGTQGEFCCLDACPRKYCTAKQAPMSLAESRLFIIPIPLQKKVTESND